MLDAGCGAARFLELWKEHYELIDLFDQSYEAMCKTKNLIRTLGLFKCATFTRASFSNYPWKEKRYDLIFLSHAIGYMDDSGLATFLSKAASHLTVDSEKRCTRNGTGNPFAAICILDNISQTGENYVKEGQWVRTSEALEKLYA